jgi:hypothetical protein
MARSVHTGPSVSTLLWPVNIPADGRLLPVGEGDQPRYAAVQRRGMERDFSRATAVKGYEKPYEESL